MCMGNFWFSPELLKDTKKNINWITQSTSEIMAIPVWMVRKGKAKKKLKVAKILNITQKSLKAMLTIRRKQRNQTTREADL